METTNVRANVRGFLRAVMAVWTLEPRQLATLVLEMLLQIILPIEDAVAFRAGKPADFLVPNSYVPLRGQSGLASDWPVEGKDIVCKQKREMQNETNSRDVFLVTRRVRETC